MAETCKEFVKEIVDQVAVSRRMTEWSFTERNFGSIGQNYFGILMSGVLRGKINGIENNLSLVLKLAPIDERYRASGAVSLMFQREIFMYADILEFYRNMKAPELLYVIPELYHYRLQYREAIVIKDMSAEGYLPYNGEMFLNLEHMKVSLQSLARFHAHSFVLKKLNETVYSSANKTCLPLTEKYNKRFMEVMDDRLSKAIENFKGTPYENVFKKLKERHVRFIEATHDSVDTLCICHGDIWKENIMFKYEDDQPVSACLIDYQTVRLSSPAFDVLYLITSSCDTNLRQRFRYLLDIYYEEFKNALTFGAHLEPREVYSKENFEKDLKIVAPACLIIANTAMWLLCGLQQEGHVRSKVILSTESEKAFAIEKYKSIIKSIVDDFNTYNYLCFVD